MVGWLAGGSGQLVEDLSKVQGKGESEAAAAALITFQARLPAPPACRVIRQLEVAGQVGHETEIAKQGKEFQ